MNVSSAAELQLYLEFAASALKKSAHGRESVGRKSPSIITDAAALRTLHRAEDIGSALKGGVKVCQRQPVNEVLGPLVTKCALNLGRVYSVYRQYRTRRQCGPVASTGGSGRLGRGPMLSKKKFPEQIQQLTYGVRFSREFMPINRGELRWS